MGREGENDRPNHETLSFAEFVNREDLRPGVDCAALVLGDSGDGRRVFPLTRNPTVIGRSNNADLVLIDPAISQFHARIIRHNFGYTVEDLGSTGGTFLRDRHVSHARLVDGDTLRLRSARMKEDAMRQHGLLFDRFKKAEVQLQLERVSTNSRYEIVAPARLDYPPGRKALVTRLALRLGLGLLLAALVLGISEMKTLFVRVAREAAATTVLLALLGPLACAHNGSYVWVEDLPENNQNSEPVIHPRDTLLVEVQKQPTLSGEFFVRDDGHYSQPMVGSIRVADQTPSQAAAAISVALRDIVVAPVVSVWISKKTSIRVSVVGEVKAPGTYELTRDRGLLPALALAGWLTEFAHSDRVFVVRVRTNERIRFRVLDITTAEPRTTQFQLADGDVVVVE